MNALTVGAALGAADAHLPGRPVHGPARLHVQRRRRADRLPRHRRARLRALDRLRRVPPRPHQGGARQRRERARGGRHRPRRAPGASSPPRRSCWRSRSARSRRARSRSSSRSASRPRRGADRRVHRPLAAGAVADGAAGQVELVVAAAAAPSARPGRLSRGRARLRATLVSDELDDCAASRAVATVAAWPQSSRPSCVRGRRGWATSRERCTSIAARRRRSSVHRGAAADCRSLAPASPRSPAASPPASPPGRAACSCSRASRANTMIAIPAWCCTASRWPARRAAETMVAGDRHRSRSCSSILAGRQHEPHARSRPCRTSSFVATSPICELGAGRRLRCVDSPRARARRGRRAAARRRRGAASTRSGCGSPARCTTWSPTRWSRSTCRPASPRTCSTRTPSRPARRCATSSRSAATRLTDLRATLGRAARRRRRRRRSRPPPGSPTSTTLAARCGAAGVEVTVDVDADDSDGAGAGRRRGLPDRPGGADQRAAPRRCRRARRSSYDARRATPCRHRGRRRRPPAPASRARRRARACAGCASGSRHSAGRSRPARGRRLAGRAAARGARRPGPRRRCRRRRWQTRP